MVKRKVVSHESVGNSVSDIEGFREGYESQNKVIKFGTLLKTLREQETQLTQTQAANLIGMSQSELSRIESGLGTQGPSYATISQIIDAYKNLLLKDKDTTFKFSVEIDRAGHHTSYLLSEDNNILIKVGDK